MGRIFAIFANMTGSAYIVFTYIFAIAGVAMMFVPRLPAVVAAFLSLLCAYFSGVSLISEPVLVYWSVAALIVLVLRGLGRRDGYGDIRGNAYISAGAVVGAFLGFAVAPTSGAVILGSALAAFIGAVAYMRIPGSPGFPIASGQFVQFLCARGLQAVVTVSVSAVSVSSVLS